MPAKPEPSTRVAGPSLEGLLRAGPPEEAGGRASASAAGSFATWRTDSITGPPGEGLEVHGKVGGIRAAVRIDAVRASPDHGTAFFTWVGVSRPAQADRPLGAGERRELLGALLNERRGLEERCESDRDLNRPLLEPLAQLRRAIALLLERMPAGPTGVVDLGDLAGAAGELLRNRNIHLLPGQALRFVTREGPTATLGKIEVRPARAVNVIRREGNRGADGARNVEYRFALAEGCVPGRVVRVTACGSPLRPMDARFAFTFNLLTGRAG